MNVGDLDIEYPLHTGERYGLHRRRPVTEAMCTKKVDLTIGEYRFVASDGVYAYHGPEDSSVGRYQDVFVNRGQHQYPYVLIGLGPGENGLFRYVLLVNDSHPAYCELPHRIVRVYRKTENWTLLTYAAPRSLYHLDLTNFAVLRRDLRPAAKEHMDLHLTNLYGENYAHDAILTATQ